MLYLASFIGQIMIIKEDTCLRRVEDTMAVPGLKKAIGTASSHRSPPDGCISEEPFYGALKNTVDNLKLRLSYGTLGNQQVGYYDYLQQIETGKVLNYSFGDKEKASYAYETAPNASDLTWETVVTKNIGLDIGIFNNRLNISAMLI